jgi:predicted O-methyltransferase YrrM
MGPKEAFVPVAPSDPSYAKALADYCCQEFLVKDRQILQVYEEFVNLAYWLRGFSPHNVLEIGVAGATFFLLSRLATGKKVAIDVRDLRSKIHTFMFGHEWLYFQGDSQSEKMLEDVRAYCETFDIIFIDGDHRYEGVKRDFENYRTLLSERGVILFHDVDPDHALKAEGRLEVGRFWAELNEGTKTMLCCTRSNGRLRFLDQTCHFGGIGIWSPT